jgi:hypothetical protein
MWVLTVPKYIDIRLNVISDKTLIDMILLTCFCPLLVLLVRLLLNGAKQGEDDAGLRVDADGGHDHLPAALHDMRAGEYHGVAVDALFDLVGLAGEGRLVNFEIVALEDDAVGGQQIAVLNLWNRFIPELNIVSNVVKDFGKPIPRHSLLKVQSGAKCICLSKYLARLDSSSRTCMMSPTTRSPICTWVACPPLMTLNVCSPSILSCSPLNCFSLDQSLNAVTRTTITTAIRIARPSIHAGCSSSSAAQRKRKLERRRPAFVNDRWLTERKKERGREGLRKKDG